LKQAAPIISLLWQFINMVAPLYVNMWALCLRAYETLPLELLEALMGFGMCFAGGAYCTSIAAVEAFRITGWDTTRRALRDVYAEAKNIHAAHQTDEKKDEDGDGKADVLALAPAELLQRKVKVLALAVKDPDKLMTALGGLYTSWLAVQGTLRLQYAKTITLGVSIANELEKPATAWLVPIVVPLIPPAYHRAPGEGSNSSPLVGRGVCAQRPLRHPPLRCRLDPEHHPRLDQDPRRLRGVAAAGAPHASASVGLARRRPDPRQPRLPRRTLHRPPPPPPARARLSSRPCRALSAAGG
jgi:hypothetical protein